MRVAGKATLIADTDRVDVIGAIQRGLDGGFGTEEIARGTALIADKPVAVVHHLAARRIAQL